MIIFLIYIITLIFIYEFYLYTKQLKVKIQTNQEETIEKFTECPPLTDNEYEFAENKLESNKLSFDALKQISERIAPLPADDTRSMLNPDLYKDPIFKLKPREKRDPRWHCIRDWMLCSKPLPTDKCYFS
jgi:hypothetical protein